jgi:hypothetical protein
VVAVLAPLSVLLGLALVLGAMGETVPTEVVRLDRALAMAAPEVVLLGNSVTTAAVDVPTIAAAMATPPVVIADLAAQGSRPPFWFAVVKNRVYAGGYAPKVILVVVPTGHMMQVWPPQDAEKVLEQMGDDEPELAAQLFDESPLRYRITRALAPRTHLRDNVINTISYGSIGVLYGHAPGESAARGGWSKASLSMSRLFGVTAKVDREAGQGSTGVTKPPVGFAVGATDPMMARLTELAAAHQARVVVGLVPLRPDGPNVLIRPGEQGIVTGLLQAHADIIDLRGADMPASMFQDEEHPSAAGKVFLTAGLAAGVRRLDPSHTGASAAGRFLQGRNAAEIAAATISDVVTAPAGALVLSDPRDARVPTER